MHWSPFPCSYDPEQYVGIPGQPTDVCYSDSAAAPPLARSLTTDGYNNLFHGVLPSSWEQLCNDGDTDGGAVGDADSSSGSGWAAPGPSPQVEQLLLTVRFRIARGRQFDRTYSFQLGSAVVSISVLLWECVGEAACASATASSGLISVGCCLLLPAVHS